MLLLELLPIHGEKQQMPGFGQIGIVATRFFFIFFESQWEFGTGQAKLRQQISQQSLFLVRSIQFSSVSLV